MRIPLLLTTALSLAAGLPQSEQTHVVHESRDSAPEHWTKLSSAAANTPLDLRIALKQTNLELAESYIREVSHPESSKYGQFWTPEQVIDAFAPSDDAVHETVAWLVQAGIPTSRIVPSVGRNWIKVKNSTVAEAEALLKTRYAVYGDEEGSTVVACEEYSVPQGVREYVDFVAPTIQFDSRTSGLAKREAVRPLARAVVLEEDPNSLKNCSGQITPACLRALYDIPEGEAVEGNSFGVVEFASQAFNQDDLDGFFSVYTTIPNGTAPVIDGIDGGYLSTLSGLGTRGESDLDLCYAMALVYPQNVTLYQTGDDKIFTPATNNNFLDAIDGSYCTFEGGDDPTYDAIYPHSAGTPGSYTGQPMCGTYNATNVISVSYESNEFDRPASYTSRECTEYMKLALMGVTVVFPSADNGVGGTLGQCLVDPDGPPTTVANRPRFNPVFPSTCPWITSVGGSSLPPNGTVGDVEVVAYEYSPGGGFSNVFALPDYQADVIASYYELHNPGYNSSHYNNSQAVRAYPDLALSSQDYITGIDGGFMAISGTSAAAPAFAAMITLINGERIKAGKGPVGFVNPVLYAHPEVFTDIVEGQTNGCNTDGFLAVEGWDPASGLGAPNYKKMLDVFMDLP